MSAPLLEVSDLRVTAPDGSAIVDGVGFEVRAGEALGLAGESGCGKTTTALSVMRLLPPSLKQTGAITLKPRGIEEAINVGRRTERGMQVVRWRHVSLVFQGAMNSLDPVQRVDEQIAEAIRLHERVAGKSEVAERIEELMSTVGLTAATARRYPHQLSGGQRQRAMVALALACSPPLVIADEPTTALDVVMQAQVLQLLERLRAELDLALILISHDLGVLAETCDRIAIMNAGKIVELGDAAQIFGEPEHEYTKELLSVVPVIGGPRRAANTSQAAGSGGSGTSHEAEVSPVAPLVEVRDLHVRFPTRAGEARAVDGVSLDWRRGEILGVVGESGCGK
ncbi:MAG: ATP-binding cassette domain-containing protein, partial [Actinomycetota bacterium]|nr:ATP-binding cassette domain-containing protein [Actinomycetota bacterium]